MSSTAKDFEIDPDKFDFQMLSDEHKPTIDCTDKDGKDGQNLHSFLYKRSKKYQNSHLGTTYMVLYEKKIIGYVTVAASSIHKDKIIQEKRPSTRDGPIFPALIIVYLAIDKKLQNCGLGTFVLKYCDGLARITARTIGCRYIILFARDAIGFYRKNKFQVAELEGEKDFKMMYADVFPEKKKEEK